MNFKLLTFLFFYFLLIYHIYWPQKQFIHTQCRQLAITTSKKQLITNTKVVDCTGCIDIRKKVVQEDLKSGYIRIYKIQDNKQRTANDHNINGYIYFQTNCTQYQCQQMQDLQDFSSKKNNNVLEQFGFTQKLIIHSNKIRNCQKTQLGSKIYGQNGECLQFEKQLSSLWRAESQAQQRNWTVRGYQKVYSLILRFRYEVSTENRSLKQAEQQEQTHSQSIIQPPSVYFYYTQFGLEASLLFALLASLVLAQSYHFFADAFASKFKFLGSRKNIMYSFVTIIFLYFYALLPNIPLIALLFNFYFLYFYLRIIFDTQKVKTYLSRIFSFSVSFLWSVNLYYQHSHQKIIILVVGFILTLMQLCFINFANSPSKDKILIVISILVIISSFYLMYDNPFQQTSSAIIRNIPLIQMIFLIASYQKQRKEIQNQNQNQKKDIFPSHDELQDLQLRISKELGY